MANVFTKQSFIACLSSITNQYQQRSEKPVELPDGGITSFIYYLREEFRKLHAKCVAMLLPNNQPNLSIVNYLRLERRIYRLRVLEEEIYTQLGRINLETSVDINANLEFS
ncbi:unnamed protein product [Caenorhabditis angaria]|uniref:Uncharacterized protein n=1 Tax=Caenorhabditis angaria TaxID=860376 RepID=A0A9P1IXF3_9PELO|nr:unnamed protein product [Caenorhabditis angaria]